MVNIQGCGPNTAMVKQSGSASVTHTTLDMLMRSVCCEFEKPKHQTQGTKTQTGLPNIA